MNRNIFFGMLIVIIVGAGVFLLMNKNGQVGNEKPETQPENNPVGELGENPEGEADPNRMTLQMKTWVWQTNTKFTLTFGTAGKFSATTDCNSMGGSFVVSANNISFSEIFSTLMYCEGSKESEFATMLQDAQSYQFTGRGEFILTLTSGSKAVFR